MTLVLYGDVVVILFFFFYFFFVFFMFFVFQAEDGIRDLVRSRGLGDVYKRQVHMRASSDARNIVIAAMSCGSTRSFRHCCDTMRAVSYTHLTLPTSDLV